MSIKKIEHLVQQFQNKTLPKAAWTHEAHLIVAVWYLYHFSKAEATGLLRAGIINYNVAVGTENTATGGYHETITLFWIWLISAYVDKYKHLKINELVSKFLASTYAERDVFFKFYSKKVLFSVDARANWIEPDLQPLKVDILISLSE